VRRRPWVGIVLATAALLAVTGPAATASTRSGAPAGWNTFTPIPVDEFGGSSIPEGYVFGGYSFSAGQNLATAYSFNLFAGWR
jgi:hypothetical protein